MDRYVALGSSMAAGPGIRPKAPGAPARSGRSAANYAHVVAERMGYDLTDVTFSGATTAHVLTDGFGGQPPQIEAIDGTESLVTVTIGGNDAGYTAMLLAAGLPRFMRSLPMVGQALRRLVDPALRGEALVTAGVGLENVGREVRRRAPQARVIFVDYLTLLPPAGVEVPRFSAEDLALGRRIGDELERLTAEAATATGCELVRAGAASRDHHPWSGDPWMTKWGLPWPGRVFPLHPNAEGMRVVAGLIEGLAQHPRV